MLNNESAETPGVKPAYIDEYDFDSDHPADNCDNDEENHNALNEEPSDE